MKKKTLFAVSLLFSTVVVFVLMWHYGSFADDPPPVSPTTIIFTDDLGIEVSINPDTVTKFEYCSMSDHPGNSSCGTENPSDHPISTKWDPSNRKVTITIGDEVVGYGQAKASITAGSTVVGGQTIEFENLGGDAHFVGRWTDPDDIKRVILTATHESYFICPEDAEPNRYTWNASCKVEIWGVDWEGTGTVTISNSVGFSWGLSSSGSYSVTAGESTSITSDISGNPSDRFKNPSGTWTVAYNAVCGHVQCSETLTDPHAHHWWCPPDNGCAYHIKCENYIPDVHQLHASCWNSEYGCEATNVRKCAHTCENEPERCGKCKKVVPTANAHEKTCINGHKYWRCIQTDLSQHMTQTCSNMVYRETSSNAWIPEYCNVQFANCNNGGCPYYISYGGTPTSSRSHSGYCSACTSASSSANRWI